MKSFRGRKYLSALATAALTIGLIGAAAGTAQAAYNPAAPPYPHDPYNVSSLTIYDATTGAVVTGGSNETSLDHYYFAAKDDFNPNHSKATLHGYLAVAGQDPGNWSGAGLSGATTYPATGAPAPVNGLTTPVVKGGTTSSFRALAGAYPNTAPSTSDFYQLYQLRVQTSFPTPTSTQYAFMDIAIDTTTGTWRELNPAPQPPPTAQSGLFTGVPTARAFDGPVGTTAVPIQIAGTAGVPSNATAVVVNTEVFQPSAAGYVRVTPFGSDASVAVQEFTTGQSISNLVTVKLVNGKIQAKVSAGSARVLMDVSGYYSDGSGSSFAGVATARAFDGTVGMTAVPIQIAGIAGVPSNATAVVVNTEVFQPSAAGYVRVTPFGSDASVAVQEFTAGQTISNLVTVKLVNGKIQGKVSAGTARVLMDVSGYYSDGAGSSFAGVSTARAFDGTVGTTARPIQIAGLAGVPANATAVVVNTEVFQPTAAGYVRVTPAGTDPSVAVQEFRAGQTISNLVVVKLVNGKIQAKVSAGSARVLMDVSGYFS